MTPDALKTLAELANGIGTIGVLVWLAWSFQTGAIVSKTTLDRILDRYSQQFEQTTLRILERIDRALEDDKRGRL